MYLVRGLGNFTDDLSAAIARFEGTCPSPSSCVNNNPGNLRAGPGSTGVDPRGIAIFPDYATGEAALQHQVDLNISRGLTLQQFFTGGPGYPGYDKTAPNYAPTVAGWLGIDPNVPLSQVSAAGGSDFSTVPADTSGLDPFAMPGSSDTAGLSGVAMVGLGIAGLALLWAVAS